MDKSIQYTHVMSNLDSVYNVTSSSTRHYSPIYVPASSFSAHQGQSMSFSPSSSNPKFNFDLYQPNEYLTQFSDYPSPSSSVIIHHQPVYSPPPSQAISKLRQINDELCYTLAQSELPTYSQPIPSNHHVHHYPVSHQIHHTPRQRDSSTESEPTEPKRHNARITYKAHIPRRRRRQQQQQQQPQPEQQSTSDFEQLLASTSDAYAQNDPLTVDLYPTRDQGYVRRIRNRPDNRSPWLPDGLPARRNSYSEQSTYRTPRAPNYENRTIQPKSRLSDCKERPRSSSVNSRFRRDNAPNNLRHSASAFSVTAPVWRPNGAVKHAKFVGSNAPPSPPKPQRHERTWKPTNTVSQTKPFRAFDPTTKAAPRKTNEPVWHPPPKERVEKSLRYFKPTLKPEYTGPIRQQTEPVAPRPTTKAANKVSRTDPQLKARITNAESKVKSAWEGGTTTSKPRPPRPPPTTTTTATLPTKPKVKPFPSQRPKSVVKVVPAPVATVDTGRSSLTGVPTHPLGHSTPRDRSIVGNDDDVVDGIFGDQSQISVLPKKPAIPTPPRPIEKTPPKQTGTTVPQSNQKNHSVIKDGVLVHGDGDSSIHDDARTPSPTSETNHNGRELEVLDSDSVQPSPILPKRKDPSSKVDDIDGDLILPDDSDTHRDAGQGFDNTESVGNDNEVHNSISKQPDVSASTLPKRKEPSPTPSDSVGDGDGSFIDESHISDNPLPPAPPAVAAPTTTTADQNVDDFFD